MNLARRCLPFLVLLIAPTALADDPGWIPESLKPWLPALELLQSSRDQEGLDRLLARQEENPDDVCSYFFPALVYLHFELPDTGYEEEVEAGFEMIRRGLDLADELEPEDPGSRYCTGGLFALRAEYRIQRGKHLGGAYDGKRFRRIMLDLREEHPDFVDCGFWVGIYEYWADVLPGYIKFFKTLLFLPSGKRERGFELMEEAAERGVLDRYSAHWMLRDFYRMEGEPEKAREALVLLHERFPGDVNASMELAWEYASNDPPDYERAVALHEEAAARLGEAEGPDVARQERRVWLSLARMHSTRRLDSGRAADVLLPVYRAARGDEKAEFELAAPLAGALNRSGRHGEAAEILADLEKRYPQAEGLPALRSEVNQFDEASSRVHVATLPARRLAAKGRTAEAEAAFRRLLEEFPDNPQIRVRLADMYFQGSEPSLARAEPLYVRVVESAPEKPSFLVPYANLRLGQICDLTGRRGEAKAYYRQAQATAGDLDGVRSAAGHYLKNRYGK